MSDDHLRIEYILLSQAAQWDKNPKRHDIGAIIQSIQAYGFKDPPKFEPALNNGKGGIVEGNGRLICLAQMKESGLARPRGIDETPEGEWAIPVLFGVDAASEAVAEAYAIDHNNLTMSGGDFDGFDMSRMYDTSYLDLLSGREVLPITVDQEGLNAMLAARAVPGLDELAEKYGEPDPEHGWPFIRVRVAPDTHTLWESLIGQAPGKDDAAKVDHLLHCVDTEALGELCQ